MTYDLKGSGLRAFPIFQVLLSLSGSNPIEIKCCKEEASYRSCEGADRKGASTAISPLISHANSEWLTFEECDSMKYDLRG